jgi:hypothetical protein
MGLEPTTTGTFLRYAKLLRPVAYLVVLLYIDSLIVMPLLQLA